MIIALCVINWTAVSAVITAITASVAVIALWQNKQQLKKRCGSNGWRTIALD